MKCNSHLTRSFALLIAFLFAGITLWAQSKTVQGTVTDAAGSPVIGVSVTVKGTTTGVTTDAQGKYSIKVPGAQSVLEFNYLGYVGQEVAVGAKTVVDVTMAEDAENIDEVVVIGYGAVKKRDLTGAVQSVKGEDITLTPTTNVMEAIQGKVAGLDITRQSGKAGSGVDMTLRGSRSINGSNTPLFIIDGVAGNYSDINPNDIKSIEVLKDASSTAIYGSAGANGVVIITTKTGEKGRLVVNFDAYYGTNYNIQFPEVRSGDDYIELRRQAGITSGSWSRGESDSKLFSAEEWSAIQNNQWVDWFKEGTRNGALQNYSISMSGGNDKTTGYFSVNYNKEEGIMRNDDLARYSFRANVDHQVTKWLKGGLNVTAAFTDQNERKGQFFTRVLCLMPLGTPYNADGTINTFPLPGDPQLSPIADMAENQYVNNHHILGLNPTAYLEVTPIKGLSIKSMVSSYLYFARQGTYKGKYSADGYGVGKSSASVTNNNRYNYRWENIINYNFTLGQDHSFGLTGVISWEKNQREEAIATAYNIDWDKYLFHNLKAGKDAPSIDSDYTQTQLMSYVARVNYSYKGRYLVTVSNRWDGSSILAKGHKWDMFPAAAVAWRISDEPFMANVSKIDNLKLRVGYGVTGNAGASAYATQSFGEAGNNLAFQETPAPYYMFSQNLSNTALSWEKSYNTNVGVDLNMFRNRLNVVVDGYYTKTKDILFERNLPASTGGFKTGNYKIWENVCETMNRGIEVVINSVNIQKKNFNWSTTLSFAANHEEITNFTSDMPIDNGGTWLIKGHPIKSYYDYKYAGIWQMNEADIAAKYGMAPGDVKIDEVKKDDYKYDANDRQVLGSPTPSWTGGLSNTFTYKGIDLTVFFQARWGQMMNYGILGWYNPSGEGNGPAIIDYWTPENPGGRFPRPRNGVNFSKLPTGASSLMYIDGSYVKLKNITLGYTLPAKITEKVKISKARFYATVSNPFIFTKSEYLKNYDPELGGADEFPMAKQFVFGVNISF